MLVIFTILHIFLFGFHMIIGFDVIRRNYRNKTYLLIFIITIINAYYHLMVLLIPDIDNMVIVDLMFGFAVSSSIFIVPFGVLVTAHLSRFPRIHGLSKIWLFIPAVGMAIFNLVSEPMVGFVRVNGSWMISTISNGLTFFTYTGCVASYFMMYLLLNVRWFIKTSLKREKLIAIVLASGLTAGFLFYLGLSVLIFHVFNLIRYSFPGLGGIYYTIWTASMWIALTMSRQLSLTPKMIGNNVLEHIDEIVILFDAAGKLVTSNSKANEFVGNNDIEIEPGMTFIKNFGDIKISWERLLAGTLQSFSAKAILSRSRGDEILVDSNFIVVQDQFGQPLGILLIAHEKGELRRLKKVFKLTDREINILYALLAGGSNKRIAETARIAESTVKTHVMHIYNKIGVDNRVKLINLLEQLK